MIKTMLSVFALVAAFNSAFAGFLDQYDGRAYEHEQIEKAANKKIRALRMLGIKASCYNKIEKGFLDFFYHEKIGKCVINEIQDKTYLRGESPSSDLMQWAYSLAEAADKKAYAEVSPLEGSISDSDFTYQRIDLMLKYLSEDLSID